MGMTRFLDIKTVAVGAITALVVAAFFIVGKNITAPAKTVINADRVSIIREMQALERLETSTFTIEKVIEAGTPEASSWKNFLFGDKLLLIAQGKVTAGFDLSRISERDIEAKGDKVRISLPSPIILSATLDSAETKVYDRKTGLFNRGEMNLESQAREAAENSIRQAACKGNILAEANRQGKIFITRMFQLAGFKEVEVVVAAGGTCE